MKKYTYGKKIDKYGRECCKCGKYQKWFNFNKSKKGTKGYDHWCKDCRNIHSAEHFRKVRRNTQLKHYFGITLVEYKQMLKKQNGVCAICKRPEIATRKGIVKQLAVDHNHATKVIRGLLCYRCNTALGLVDEDQEILKTMINYLISDKNIN